MNGKQIATSVAIIVVETVAFTVMFKMIMRPDSAMMIRMKTFKSLEIVCQRNAQAWAHMADVSKYLYDQSRSSI